MALVQWTWLSLLAAAAATLGCEPSPHARRARYAEQPETARYAAFVPPELRAEGAFVPREEWWPFRGHDVHLDRVLPLGERERARRTKVVLVHGGGGNGRLLAPFAVMLARHGYETVAPDLPPYGLTRRADGPLTWEMWIALASALAERESESGTRPVVLFGLSIGGMTALQATERSPDVFGTIATTLLDLRDPENLSLAARDTFLARVGLFFMKHAPWLSSCFWLPAREIAPIDKLANDPSLATLAENDPLVGGARAPGSFWRSMYRPAQFVPAENVRKPVLLVHPGDDRWTPPKASLRFFERVRGPKRGVVLDGGGHFPIEAKAFAQLEAEVIAFLETVP
jgi:alpha-beta hydrolase superfamily lysophospholipase